MSEKNIPCDENSFLFDGSTYVQRRKNPVFTKNSIMERESHLVKQSIEAMNHSHYQFENEKQEEQIKSIMYSEDNRGF